MLAQIVGNEWTPANVLFLLTAVAGLIVGIINTINHRGTATKTEANCSAIKTIEGDVYTTNPQAPVKTDSSKAPLLILLLVAPLLMLQGCVSAGSDPVLLTAQRVDSTSFDAVNGFLQAEYAERDTVKRTAPTVDAFAIKLGHDAQPAFKALHAAEDAYVANKNAATANGVDSAVASVAALASALQPYADQLARAKGK